MIVGTVYDVNVHQKILERNRTFKKNNGNGKKKINWMRKTKIEIIRIICRLFINLFFCLERQIDLESSGDKPRKYEQLLLCFSIYTNSRTIFSTKVGEDSIGVIHGLRFLSIFWITLIHSELYAVDYTGIIIKLKNKIISKQCYNLLTIDKRIIFR